MISTESFSLIISILSLSISIWTAVKTISLTKNEIRLSKRVELHSLFQSIEQVLIDKPALALIFKSENDHTSNFEVPSIPVQEAYIFMHFNLFELAFSLFKETRALNPNEIEISNAWEYTIEDFFSNCPRAPEVWKEYKLTYYTSFRNYVDGILAKLASMEK